MPNPVHPPSVLKSPATLLDQLKQTLPGRFYLRVLKPVPGMARLMRLCWRTLLPVLQRLLIGMHWAHVSLRSATTPRVLPPGKIWQFAVTGRRWMPMLGFHAAVSRGEATWLTQQRPLSDTAAPAVASEGERLRAIQVSDGWVFGKSNFLFRRGICLHHDWSHFATDYTSEELHQRALIDPVRRRIAWRELDLEPVELAVAGAFLDACSGNYAHWLTEVLPRILQFCQQPDWVGIPLLVDARLHPNLIDSLHRTIDPSRPLHFVGAGQAVFARTLITLTPSGYIPFDRRTGCPAPDHQGRFLAPALSAMVAHLRKSLPATPTVPPRRLLIRRNAGARLLRNQQDLERALLAQGFEVVEPELLPFDRQVQLFAQAGVVVAPTGAALANLLFCDANARIVVLAARHPDMPTGYWSAMATATGCRVDCIEGEGVGDAGLGIHRDFTVPVETVVAHVCRLAQEQQIRETVTP